MLKYETFSETLAILMPTLEDSVDRTFVNSWGSPSRAPDYRKLAVSCRNSDLHPSTALALCAKGAFEEFAREESFSSAQSESVDMSDLSGIAGTFELFSPIPSSLPPHVSDVYGTDAGAMIEDLLAITKNRFYLQSGIFLRDDLPVLLAGRGRPVAHGNAEASSRMLREKISAEKSCELKAYQLLTAKAETIEIRSRFLGLFPGYRREFLLQSKLDALRKIRKSSGDSSPLDGNFLDSLAETLLANAGIGKDMDLEMQAERLEGFIRRGYMDMNMAAEFHRKLTGNIRDLLKFAHPDKWGQDGSDAELRKQIADRSGQLIRLHELSRLGPGVRTFQLIMELESWKKDFALLHPEATRELFKRKKEFQPPLADEIRFWEASECFLTEQLELILSDGEISKMRTILDAPEMHSSYEKAIQDAITGKIHAIEQLIMESTVARLWKAVMEIAAGRIGSAGLLEDSYG